MGGSSGATLLMPDEGPAAAVMNPEARSPFVLVCEHASRRIPRALGDLGLDAAARESHAAYDIGALGVAERLADALDAVLVHQRFSRLAYDCNRPPDAPDAMPERSEIYAIPGNRNLDDAARALRVEGLYEPFHAAVMAAIEARVARGIAPILVTIHSFTPVYHGRLRELDLGVLHDADARLSDRILAAAASQVEWRTRRNEPYGPADGVTHTLKLHAAPRGLLNTMLEIKNDLIADDAGQALWARRLTGLLEEATRAGAEKADHPKRGALG